MGNFNRGGGHDGGSRGGFNKGGRDFGRPSFQKKSWGNDDRGQVSMHSAICAECGKSCEVPFAPKNGKPVYCKECFGNRGGGFDDRSEKRSFNNDRPAFRPAPSFEQPRNDGDIKRRLEALDYKLDKLTRSVDLLLTAKLPKEVSVAPAKDSAKVKKELTDVVTKVSKDIKEEKEVKTSKPAKKAAPAKKAKKGKK